MSYKESLGEILGAEDVTRRAELVTKVQEEVSVMDEQLAAATMLAEQTKKEYDAVNEKLEKLSKMYATAFLTKGTDNENIEPLNETEKALTPETFDALYDPNTKFTKI